MGTQGPRDDALEFEDAVGGIPDAVWQYLVALIEMRRVDRNRLAGGLIDEADRALVRSQYVMAQIRPVAR